MIYALYKYTIYIQIMYFFFYFVIKIIAQCTNAYSPLFFNAIHIHLLLLFGWKMTRSWQVLSESTLNMSLPWLNRHVFLFSLWEIYILKACVSSEDKEEPPCMVHSDLIFIFIREHFNWMLSSQVKHSCAKRDSRDWSAIATLSILYSVMQDLISNPCRHYWAERNTSHVLWASWEEPCCFAVCVGG